jgi:hypothetical protein
MAKYAKYQRKSPAKHGMNPVWRGIGCVLIVLMPLLAFGLMMVSTPGIIATGLVPYQLLGYVHFPAWAFRVQITSDIALFIGSINNIGVNIVVFIVILLILAGITSLLYTALYQVVGPARYSSLDAPPSKYKGKKYTR